MPALTGLLVGLVAAPAAADPSIDVVDDNGPVLNSPPLALDAPIRSCR